LYTKFGETKAPLNYNYRAKEANASLDRNYNSIEVSTALQHNGSYVSYIFTVKYIVKWNA
jgi:hypothetical protein